MATATLSVITPTYNCGRYIARSYKNICEQSYANWEWIVVNDGSTDETYSLINEIAKHDHRVKVHHFSENKGRGAARQAAINLSSTDMIVVWDIDDLYHHQRLISIYNSLIKEKFDYFCSYALVVTNDFKLKGGRHFYRNISYSPSFVHPTLAFNKRNVQMFPYYDEKMKAGEDFELMMELESKYNGEYSREYLMLYFEDREVNIWKTLDVHNSHYYSLKKYLTNLNCSRWNKIVKLMRMKIKGIVLKLFVLYPRLYLETVKFRNIELADFDKIDSSILKLVYESEIIK